MNSGFFRRDTLPFFCHTFQDSDIEHLDSTKPDFIEKAAEFLLLQQDKFVVKEGHTAQKLKTTRQFQAYANSLLWQKEDGVNFELVDTALMIYPIHNFRGKQFRCEWYEEQLFWSEEDHRHLEGLSLSHVLHRWRRRGGLLPNTDEDKWGEMMMLREDGKDLDPSGVKFKVLVKKGESIVPPSAPQHFIKLHSAIKVRKFYLPK